MRTLLDKLDPFFAAAAIALAGATVMSQVPNPLIPITLPSFQIADSTPAEVEEPTIPSP